MDKRLDKKQRQELLNELQFERSRRYADRIRVILLLDQEWTYKKIAEALFIDEGSIANYRTPPYVRIHVASLKKKLIF